MSKSDNYLFKYHDYILFLGNVVIQTFLNFQVVKQKKLGLKEKKSSVRSKYKWTKEELGLLELWNSRLCEVGLLDMRGREEDYSQQTGIPLEVGGDLLLTKILREISISNKLPSTNVTCMIWGLAAHSWLSYFAANSGAAVEVAEGAHALGLWLTSFGSPWNLLVLRFWTGMPKSVDLLIHGQMIPYATTHVATGSLWGLRCAGATVTQTAATVCLGNMCWGPKARQRIKLKLSSNECFRKCLPKIVYRFIFWSCDLLMQFFLLTLRSLHPVFL